MMWLVRVAVAAFTYSRALRHTRKRPVASTQSHAAGGSQGELLADDAAQFQTTRGKPQSKVRVSGRQLLVDGSAFHIKGVCWNPVPKGGTHPANLDYSGFADGDGDLMVAAGINVVRSYEPITDRAVLDILWSKGLRVAMNVYPWGGSEAVSAIAAVAAVKDHPAVLMWEVGNEWNYNGLYIGLSFEEARARVAEVVSLIKEEDTTHPVVTIYGELPSVETLSVLSQVDMWGINAYRFIGLGDLFEAWEALSDKPMYVGEFGADAWNANTSSPDYAAQAFATTNITKEIVANSAVTGGVCSGGAIFEFADEWWKDSTGSPDTHDAGGWAPGGGPYPDSTFNEEWWGLVDVDRNPRAAYQAYKEVELEARGRRRRGPPGAQRRRRGSGDRPRGGPSAQ